jgi:hypothetical protein
MHGNDAWGFSKLSMQCACDIVLAEDPNGEQGRQQGAPNSEQYWLGERAANPLISTNLTFAYDATMCSAAPTGAPPAPDMCALVSSINSQWWSGVGRVDPKFVEFQQTDGMWTAPQRILGGWVLSGRTYTDDLQVPVGAQAIRVSTSSNADAVGLWKLVLDCGVGCPIVLLEDPNGKSGTARLDAGYEAYWLDSTVAGGVKTFPLSLSTCAPTAAPTAPPPTAAPTLSVGFWFKVWTADSAIRDGTWGSPMVAFMVNGVWTDATRLANSARRGSLNQQYVTLAAWPTQVVLTMDNKDDWQFWRVSMFVENRNCEVVLLENPAGSSGSALDGTTDGVYWLGRKLSTTQITYLTPYNPDQGETQECVASLGGAAYDGYLTTCRVQVDHESGIAIHTNDDGSYSLDAPADVLETVELVITPDLDDCSDVGTGEALAIVLRGPPGCTALTPMTTLLAAVMAAANATVADADAMIRSALGLPAGEPLMHHDAIATSTHVNATHEDAADSLQTMVALTKVHSFLLQVRMVEGGRG